MRLGDERVTLVKTTNVKFKCIFFFLFLALRIRTLRMGGVGRGGRRCDLCAIKAWSARSSAGARGEHRLLCPPPQPLGVAQHQLEVARRLALSLAARGPRAREGPRQLEQRLQTCRRDVGAEVEAGGCRLGGGGMDAGRGALLRSEEASGLVRG